MKQKIILGYKSVTDGLKSGNGDITWKVGVWQKHLGKVELCKAGFHASKHPMDTLEYLQGDRFFLVEAQGEILEQSDKFVASEMRLVREVKDLKLLSVEFAIWNARQCLKNYESKVKGDLRVRQAIEAAEAFVKNPCKVNQDKVSAARSAAWSAARSAARSAAWSAASAARSAAWSAASAARSAAWSAAESAQRRKFLQLIKKHTEKKKLRR